MHAHNSATSSDEVAIPTYLLVHGSGTSSSMWGPLQRELALRGLRSFAIDLPGHGFDADYPVAYQAPQDLDGYAEEPSVLAQTTLDDNVEAVLAAARRLHAHGPVILVGASLGGLTIGLAAHRAPEVVDGLVYISAWACVERANPYEYMIEPEFADNLMAPLAALNIGDPAQLGVGRANYRTADRQLLAALKAATMADVDDRRFLAFLAHMQPDESVAVMMGDARVDSEEWARTPRMFLRLTEDRTLPVAMQDRLIREADARFPQHPFVVRSLDSSHAGFVFRSAEVADAIIALR